MLETFKESKTKLADAQAELAAIRADVLSQLRTIAEANPDIKLYPRGRTIRKAATGANSGNIHADTVAAKVVRLISASPNKRMGASAIREAFRNSGDMRTLNFTILRESGIINSVGTEEPNGVGRPGYVYALA